MPAHIYEPTGRRIGQLVLRAGYHLIAEARGAHERAQCEKANQPPCPPAQEPARGACHFFTPNGWPWNKNTMLPAPSSLSPSR